MIERLWRFLKQEAVYLPELQDGFQVKCVIKGWISFYNTERHHAAVDNRSPDVTFFDTERPRRRHETNQITSYPSYPSRKTVLKSGTTSEAQDQASKWLWPYNKDWSTDCHRRHNIRYKIENGRVIL
ncbi:MAG: integrase core domain-containing protein [Lentilitoribacter sp.]